jgi:DNA-binding response OmpR family regulator
VVGDLRLDRESWQAALCGQALQFTSVEFDLLLSLAKAAGRVKTREQLLSEVADRHFDISDRSIDVHISSIRKKLGDDPRCPRFITTIRGAGYMLRKDAVV